MKILIVDKMHESIIPLLEELSYEVHYRPEIDRESILAVIPSYEGIVVRSKTTIDADFIDKSQHLKFVARAGAGLDNVDMDALNKYSIQLFNAPEGNRDAVAEHTVGLMLALLNKIPQSNAQVKQFIWDRELNRGTELMDKTVGLLGYGYMGQAVAKRLSAFGCNIVAYDIHLIKDENQLVRIVDFETFTAEVEILSIHIPLNYANKLLVNTDYLSNFQQLKYIINTSRGEVLKLSALLKLLNSGTLKGAALDVLENEKLTKLSTEETLVFEALRKLDNIILTPHVAGWTHESYRKINEVLVEKIKNSV